MISRRVGVRFLIKRIVVTLLLKNGQSVRNLKEKKYGYVYVKIWLSEDKFLSVCL